MPHKERSNLINFKDEKNIKGQRIPVTIFIQVVWSPQSLRGLVFRALKGQKAGKVLSIVFSDNPHKLLSVMIG